MAAVTACHQHWAGWSGQGRHSGTAASAHGGLESGREVSRKGGERGSMCKESRAGSRKNLQDFLSLQGCRPGETRGCHQGAGTARAERPPEAARAT